MACSHYTFAHYLYGVNGKDPYTGTPLSAPFERTGLTMTMLGIVAALQACWFLFTVVPLVPVLGMFLPVVLLAAFILPFGAVCELSGGGASATANQCRTQLRLDGTGDHPAGGSL